MEKIELTTVREFAFLSLGAITTLAVVVGAFSGLPGFSLSLLAWLSLCFTGKKGLLQSTVDLVRQFRGDLPSPYDSGTQRLESQKNPIATSKEIGEFRDD